MAAGADVTLLYTLDNIGNVRLYDTTVWSSVAGNMSCITTYGMPSSILEVDSPLLCRSVVWPVMLSCSMARHVVCAQNSVRCCS